MTTKRDTCGCVCNFDTFKDQFDSGLHFQGPNADACWLPQWKNCHFSHSMCQTLSL